MMEAADSSGFPAYAGKLKDKIILIKRTDSLPLGFKPDANRYTPIQNSKTLLITIQNHLPQHLQLLRQQTGH
ncbi:MAG: hypothetical protein WDM78_24185 [Puia sp.]